MTRCSPNRVPLSYALVGRTGYASTAGRMPDLGRVSELYGTLPRSVLFAYVRNASQVEDHHPIWKTRVVRPMSDQFFDFCVLVATKYAWGPRAGIMIST